MAAGEAGCVSWLVDLRRYARPQPGQIGPGRLVLVVGPSGAGKDTLIAGARAACTDDPTVVFPRRAITRLSTASEDHDTLSKEAFGEAIAAGDFALWWEAHGHRYGIPSSIDADIRSGRIVVCNVSRTVLGLARQRYASVTVVLVTAPQKVLETRLAGRARTSDGNVADRIGRSAQMQMNVEPDVEIQNVGRVEIGVRRLLNAIRDPGIFVAY
jgi:ribose 1,5-bisphosphokinase